MKNILFINACPRPMSRTLKLAQAVLKKTEGNVQEMRLYEDGPEPLNWESLKLRDQFQESRDFSHPMFRWARQFAEADEIIVAAPYWDLLFPAVVRSYFEAVTVSGLTFAYGENGIPKGLCRAGKLTYVTTAGGPIYKNLGFDYVDTIARLFYGINEIKCVKAEGLDIWGADVETILEEAKKSI